ncbi:MAG: TIR domain-containing protein [Anaerolineae bacterium]
MHDEHDELDDLIIEGYCMSCRESVEIEEPQAVWTRKGQAATRGTCPNCGGTVFRMGKTELHDEQSRPDPIEIGDGGDKRTAPKLTRNTVYLNYAPDDEALAERLADDLEKSGLAIWLHDLQEKVSWSSGVHPALKECEQMVLVLSEASLHADDVQTAWQYFREARKPIVIAQVDTSQPPDRIRRSPRFNLADNDYKSTMRQLVRQLADL